MKAIVLPLIVVFWSSASVGFAQTFTSGDWRYTLNDANEATITGYSGLGGSVEIPEMLDGNPVKQVGIGSSIFGFRNSSVNSLTVPDSVAIIGHGAFQECIGLGSVSLGNGVTSIGGWAFHNCTSLTSFSIPGSVKSIGGWAFHGCYALASVAIGAGVTSIGDWAFSNCTSLTGAVIPGSVTGIGEYAFANCASLADLTLGIGVTSIGHGAFSNCTSLTSVTIPDSVTSIGQQAFYSCFSLTSVTIGNGLVLAIGAQAFAYCPLVGTIELPLLATVDTTAFPAGATFTRNAVALVKAVAAEILAALPQNYGIATKEDLGTVLSNTIAQVQAAPNDYNLFSAAQYDENRTNGQTDVVSQPNTFGLFDSTQYEANRITGVAEGKAEVTSNPTAYSLFTESSIMDMNLGGLMLKKGANANVLDLELTIETKDNLATDGWQVSERITLPVSMEGDGTQDHGDVTRPPPRQKHFLRVRAGAPYVAPNVKVLAHPTLGNILTDGAGRVLYYFAADSAGGNPLFSGASWPYVTVPEAPKADAGVSATLASSTFGKPGGPYLTVNARPVYTYVGDAEAGQANGHGAGWVWYTIRADGVINQ